MTVLPAGLDALRPVRPADLVGTWHLRLTNFPMWLTGKKRRPTLNYESLDVPHRLRDIVRFETPSGRAKEIRGVDTQDAANPAHFTWRGAGLLAALSSDWYVLHLDGSAGAAAIYFTRTLFTPEGMDIVTRSEADDLDAIEAAVRSARSVPGLDAMIPTLRRLP